jgi:hypothetical protein
MSVLTAPQAFQPRILDLSNIRTDGGTQPRVAIFQNVIEEYADSLVEGAIFPPIVLFYDGVEYWLADGFHRHAAYKQLGIDEITAEVRRGTRRDAVLFSVGANAVHGQRRTNEDKRRATMTLLEDEQWSKWSDQEIARRVVVSPTTVGTLRKSLSKLDSEPRIYTTKHGAVATMQTANIGRPAAPEVRASCEFVAPANDNQKTRIGGGSIEWYTPEESIELARDVLGHIDVDPASNDLAQKTVKAAKYWTAETNGLDKDWNGAVWLNPPFSQPLIGQFVEKLIQEFTSGRTVEAILLTNNYTETKWFDQVFANAAAVCFGRKRVRFYTNGGDTTQLMDGQAFSYFGKRVERFAEIFSQIGNVVCIHPAVPRASAVVV